MILRNHLEHKLTFVYAEDKNTSIQLKGYCTFSTTEPAHNQSVESVRSSLNGKGTYPFVIVADKQKKFKPVKHYYLVIVNF